MMAWGDRPYKPHTPYPDQRPGSGWSDRREEIAQRESWRDKAARLGINARSFDDLNEQIDHQDDQCRMAQIEQKAESKLTDAQLAGVPEPTIFSCSFCGHEGTAADLIEPKKFNGDGLGEWVCRVGVGCRRGDWR